MASARSHTIPVPVADIPTLSYLYRNNLLGPTTEENVPPPNQDHNDKICTIQTDITKLNVDVVVNAANNRLRGGGGVDGAIHRAAGPGLLKECITLGGCETGSAKITDAYNLPSKKVIHAVGPIFEDEETSGPLLRAAYKTALKLAVENGCKTIAFPAISTGVYGYPSRAAAQAALAEIRAFVNDTDGHQLEKIVLCNFVGNDVDAYDEFLPTFFPPTEDDLSHTGEYDMYTVEFPPKISPTDAQSRLSAKSEPGVAALLQATMQEPMNRPVYNSENAGLYLDGASSDQATSASCAGDNVAVEHKEVDVEMKKNSKGKERADPGQFDEVSTQATPAITF